MSKQYIAIDLKSFYASVECVERRLNPMTTNLVVADASRTEKTICLAVSPSLKSLGIPGRPRLFEVISKIRRINYDRLRKAPGTLFTGESIDSRELMQDRSLSISYITAVPRMALYIDYSARIYSTYLKYISPDDIHVYSIDEVFIDATGYLDTYGMTAGELARRMIKSVTEETGIPAAAGVGTNLYLAKVAMDIVAKHIPVDDDGVRVAELDEMSYRRRLWDHRPITDFWRVGKGYAAKLHDNGLYTMGDIARCSVGGPADFHNEELLYRLFGVNAELLIDHAWGWEPCGMADIKGYRPASESMGCGQVLQEPYSWEKARLVVCEMAESLVLELVDKELVTDQMVLTVGYDATNLSDPAVAAQYRGPMRTDSYGRRLPRHAHGTVNMECMTSSSKKLCKSIMGLYDSIVDRRLLVRRINISANHIVKKDSIGAEKMAEQLSLFDSVGGDGLFKVSGDAAISRESIEDEQERERKVQETVLRVKKKFGKNALVKGMSLEEGATAMERNRQIGGHKA